MTEMESGFAVLLHPDSFQDPSAAARVVAQFRAVGADEAERLVVRSRGILVEGLPEADASSLVEQFQAAGVQAFSLPDAKLAATPAGQGAKSVARFEGGLRFLKPNGDLVTLGPSQLKGLAALRLAMPPPPAQTVEPVASGSLKLDFKLSMPEPAAAVDRGEALTLFVFCTDPDLRLELAAPLFDFSALNAGEGPAALAKFLADFSPRAWRTRAFDEATRGIFAEKTHESPEELERECRGLLSLQSLGILPPGGAPEELPPTEPAAAAVAAPLSASATSPKPAVEQTRAKERCPNCQAEHEPGASRCPSCAIDFLQFIRQRAAAREQERAAAAPPPVPPKEPIAWNAWVGRAAVLSLVGCYLLFAPLRGLPVPAGSQVDKEYGVAYKAPDGWTLDAKAAKRQDFRKGVGIDMGVGELQLGLIAEEATQIASFAGPEGTILLLVAEGDVDDDRVPGLAKLLAPGSQEIKKERSATIDKLSSAALRVIRTENEVRMLIVPGAYRSYVLCFYPDPASRDGKTGWEAFQAGFRVLQRPYTPAHLWRFLVENALDEKVWGVLFGVISLLFWLLKRDPEPLGEETR